MKRMALALWTAAFLVGATVQAQENATLTLRSGERVSGQLVDLGGVGYTVRVNGQERQIPQHDVAVIDFGSPISDADWANFNGAPRVVLRNGQTIDGQLYDIGGTSPLRLTLKTSTGDRELSSNEVARILIARPNNATANTTNVPTAITASGGSAITVPANQPWTPTGFNVSKGQTLTFNSTGEIQLSTDSTDVATGDGAKSGRHATRAAVPQAAAGALIGRVGNGRPFPIGQHGTIQVPATGQLFLGINDDGFADNSGSFQVTVQTGLRPRQ